MNQKLFTGDISSELPVIFPTENTGYINSVGNVVIGAGLGYYSDFIPITNPIVVLCGQLAIHNASTCIYDETKTFIGKIIPIDGRLVEITNRKAKFIKICTFTNATKIYYIDTTVTYKKQAFDFMKTSDIQLTFTSNIAIRRADGVEVSLAGYQATGFIDISQYGGIELMTGVSNDHPYNNWFYDENCKPIVPARGAYARWSVVRFERPYYAKYIRIVKLTVDNIPYLIGGTITPMLCDKISEYKAPDVIHTYSRIDLYKTKHPVTQSDLVETQSISFLPTGLFPSMGCYMVLYKNEPCFLINGTFYKINLTKI